MNSKKLLIKLGTTFLKLAGLALAAFVLYKAAIMGYEYGFRIFAEEPIDREPGVDVNVAIVEGKSVKEIGKLLEEKGLIRDGTLFVFQEKLSEYAGDLKPGNYTLNTSQTPYEMMAIMAQENEEELSEKEEKEQVAAKKSESEEKEEEQGEEEGQEGTQDGAEGTEDAAGEDVAAGGFTIIENGGN